LAGILLDTHALYWLVSGVEPLAEPALVAIGENQEAGALFVSPITAWELAVAMKKPRVADRPRLTEHRPDRWFRDAVRAIAARVVPIQRRISSEAANVVTETGHKDPGDCFLIATAIVRRLRFVTRDGFIRAVANERPDYLDVIPC
jgi:PIN domain nuclease of toxin-antitoxin system